MGVVLARAVLNRVSGIPKDAVSVDFVFSKDATPALDVADLADGAGCVQQFFNFTTAGIGVGSYIGAQISRAANAHIVEYYDITAHLDGSAHGSPILVSPFSVIDPVGATVIPSECSAVVTLYGAGRPTAPVSIPNPSPPPPTLRPKQSLTGRLYVGPLTSDGFEVGASNEVQLSAALITVLKAGATETLNQATAATVFWDVWSRRNASIASIFGGRIDNAPDTQRRRGQEPTTRTLWP